MRFSVFFLEFLLLFVFQGVYFGDRLNNVLIFIIFKRLLFSRSASFAPFYVTFMLMSILRAVTPHLHSFLLVTRDVFILKKSPSDVNVLKYFFNKENKLTLFVEKYGTTAIFCLLCTKIIYMRNRADVKDTKQHMILFLTLNVYDFYFHKITATELSFFCTGILLLCIWYLACISMSVPTTLFCYTVELGSSEDADYILPIVPGYFTAT